MARFFYLLIASIMFSTSIYSATAVSDYIQEDTGTIKCVISPTANTNLSDKIYFSLQEDCSDGFAFSTTKDHFDTFFALISLMAGSGKSIKVMWKTKETPGASSGADPCTTNFPQDPENLVFDVCEHESFKKVEFLVLK